LWGCVAFAGSLLFGISLGYIGIALSFTLLVGSMSLIGILLPMVIFNADVLDSFSGMLVLTGIIFFLVPLFFGFKAGRLREKSTGAANSGKEKGVILRGMFLAITGGALSGMLSLGMSMAWSNEIISKAVQWGHADLSYAGNAALGIVLAGGLLPNAGYCFYLLCKNKSWHLYKRDQTYWFAIMIMGILYSGSVGLWGISISESMLGGLGLSVGWALFIGMIVVSSNVTGYLAGEWKGADKKAIRMSQISLGWIILALTLIGSGNYLS